VTNDLVFIFGQLSIVIMIANYIPSLKYLLQVLTEACHHGSIFDLYTKQTVTFKPGTQVARTRVAGALCSWCCTRMKPWQPRTLHCHLELEKSL
jgi:hypothetical protein